jgi:hypothetical protein
MLSMQLLARLPDEEEYTFRLFYHPTFSQKDQGRTKHAVNVLLNGEVDWGTFRGVEVASRLAGCYARAKVTVQNNDEYGRSNNIREILPAQDAMGGFTS